MFQTSNLNVFGQNQKILAKDISFCVNDSEIVTLLGVNGAGKTSIALSITGHLQFEAAIIEHNGKSLKGLKAHDIAAQGISFVGEEKQIIQGLTVLDHLEIVCTFKGLFPSKKWIKERQDYIFNLFPILFERRFQEASTLSGGEQQMLCLASALMKDPSFLILDEPSQGLSIQMIEKFFNTLSNLKKEGLSILLIEQNFHHALSIADRGYVLENGRIVLSGLANDLKNNPNLGKICLGLAI